jgi:hypothetical protein
MKRAINSVLMLILTLSVFAVISNAGEVDLPKTGQTTCYDASGSVIDCANTGQDGDVQAGVAWPEPRFEDNSDGTVTDHLTGLVWLKNANCFGAMNWTNALTACNSLASGSCGLSDDTVAGDWRLPNVVELESLVNTSASNSLIWLNDQGFTGVQSAMNNYWSASTDAHGTGSVWVVYVVYGYVDSSIKTSSTYVWPVRGGH